MIARLDTLNSLIKQQTVQLQSLEKRTQELLAQKEIRQKQLSNLQASRQNQQTNNLIQHDFEIIERVHEENQEDFGIRKSINSDLPLKFICCIQLSGLLEDKLLQKQIIYSYNKAMNTLKDSKISGSVSQIYFGSGDKSYYEEKDKPFKQPIVLKHTRDNSFNIKACLDKTREFIKILQQKQSCNIVLLFFLHSPPIGASGYMREAQKFQEEYPNIIKVGFDFMKQETQEQNMSEIKQMMCEFNGDKKKDNMIKINEDYKIQHYYPNSTLNGLQSVVEKLVEYKQNFTKTPQKQSKPNKHFFSYKSQKAKQQIKQVNAYMLREQIEQVQKQIEEENTQITKFAKECQLLSNSLEENKQNHLKIRKDLNQQSNYQQKITELQGLKQNQEEAKRDFLSSIKMLSAQADQNAKELQHKIEINDQYQMIVKKVQEICSFYSYNKQCEIQEIKNIILMAEELITTIQRLLQAKESDTLEREQLVEEIRKLEKACEAMDRILPIFISIYHS